MRSFGVYKKKLYQIFFPAGLLILLIIGGLSGYSWSAGRKSNYLHYLTDSTNALEMGANVTMTIVSRGLNDAMRNPELNQWAAARTRSDFYYYAVNATNQLKTITTDSSLVDYDLAVTTLSPKELDGESIHMVLTKTGSVSMTEFFLQTKGLSEADVEHIFEHFSNSSRPLVLAYYEDTDFHSLYYITKSARTSSQLLCFVTIPKQSLTGTSVTNDFILYDSDGILAYSSNQEEKTADLNQLYEKLSDQQDTPQRYEGKYVLIASISSAAWEIAYIYDTYAINTGQIIIFIFGILLLLLILLYVIYQLVELLYQPVREVLSDPAVTLPEAGEPIDEFKVIRQNSERIRTLSQSLMEALEEKNQLASQRICRQLLFSPDPKGADSLSQLPADREYLVALLEFQPGRTEYSPNITVLQKGYVQDFCLLQNTIVYVDVDHQRAALIIPGTDPGWVRQLLYTMLHYLEQQPEGDSGEPRIALSSHCEGIREIHKGYREAVNILEYKHLYGKSKILTYEQIAQVDAVTYSYPLSMENRLVHNAVEGKEEALLLFDGLIRTNLLEKTLSAENTQSLVYAAIGTISRIFQELKTTPEELIGTSVDFKYWYDHWSDSVTISQIRRTLQLIIEAVDRRNNQTDQALLKEMLNYIYENYSDDIMLNDMADHFNISPKYCGILFKQLSDNNFKDFLNRYRIEKAKAILDRQPDIKITELSQLVGFNSSNSFIRVFGKYTGITPKAYVEQSRR